MNIKTISRILSLLIIVLITVSISWADTLKWDYSTGTVDGYRIFCDTSSPPKTVVAELSNSASEFSLDTLNLDIDKLYYVAVKAFNSKIESGYSTIVEYTRSVVDTTPPAVPTGISVN